jgi:nitrate reductase gamma subunit
MEAWLAWAKGPAFLFAISFMALGLIRHAALTMWEVGRAVHRAGDKSISYRKIAVATLKWLVPVSAFKSKVVYGVTTVVFHICVILTQIFLCAHIELLRRSLGISWPAIPNCLADALTAITIVTALALIIERATAKNSKHFSRFQDYAIPFVIAIPFASGLLAANPSVNPFPYEATMFVHVMSANLVLILIPITKLSHVILLPTTQIVSEVTWHFTPDAGSKVGAALGKENEPI